MEKDPIPQATSPLATWLSYLEHLHSKTIDLGLARVSQVARQMDIVKPAPFVFTVAGTNGKGTTCRTLETVLMAAGYKVGVYSSPHLVRYTERVRIQGAELPEAAHTASFAEIEAARGDISLTYFEYGTLSALWLFKQAQLDVVILEVGLGGVSTPPISWMPMSPWSPASRSIIPTGWGRIAKVSAGRKPVSSAPENRRW
jgi:dihydrofolate synthase/folylpolyglutamate synthase